MRQKQKSFFKVLILFVLVTFFVFPQNLSAFGLHTLSDKMTRHAPLTTSDHQLKFITPSGIGNSGQYLRVSFDPGFDLSNIDYTDIDLTHGPTTGLEKAEILNSTVTSTAWGVTVSGSQIDFWHPNDNANGDISPNDIIVIKIGLNASGGNQQIINPATVGSKVIRIDGNFGDSGNLAVAIFQDQIGVQGQPPLTPPTPVVLDDPFNISTNSMDLSWSVNYDYDFDRYELYISQSPGVTNLNGTLLVTYYDRNLTDYSVTNLLVNTTYYYVVYVYDTEGLSAPSNEVTATTDSSGGSDVPPSLPLPPAVYERECPIFISPFDLAGIRQAGTTIFVNGTSQGVIYPTATTWVKSVDLSLGDNNFTLFARNASGQNSNIVAVTVTRWRVGDTNGDFRVDDFDLSGLAAHFWTDWCFADFNHDDWVDDFDLSGLAANWDNVY